MQLKVRIHFKAVPMHELMLISPIKVFSDLAPHVINNVGVEVINCFQVSTDSHFNLSLGWQSHPDTLKVVVLALGVKL